MAAGIPGCPCAWLAPWAACTCDLCLHRASCSGRVSRVLARCLTDRGGDQENTRPPFHLAHPAAEFSTRLPACTLALTRCPCLWERGSAPAQGPVLMSALPLLAEASSQLTPQFRKEFCCYWLLTFCLH